MKGTLSSPHLTQSPRLACLAICAPLTVLAPKEVGAQELVISAAFGGYAPLVEVFETNAGQVRKNTSDIYAGARLGVTGIGRFGFEGSIGFSPSDARMENNPGFPNITFDDRVLLGSIRATFDVFRFGNNRVFVAGGGAVIHREEERLGIMNSFESVTSYGVVLGAGRSFPLIDALAFRADLEDYIYSVGLPDSVLAQANFKTQHDVVLTLGLAFMIPLRASGQPNKPLEQRARWARDRESRQYWWARRSFRHVRSTARSSTARR